MSRKELSTPTLIPPSPSKVISERIEGERARLEYYQTIDTWAEEKNKDLTLRINKLEEERRLLRERRENAPNVIKEIQYCLTVLENELVQAQQTERESKSGGAKTTRQVVVPLPSWMTTEIIAGLRAAGQDPQKVAQMARGGK